MLNCVLLTSSYDLVLSKVIFSPNFLFSLFSPFDFLPHLQTLGGGELNYIQACCHVIDDILIRFRYQSLQVNKAGYTATPVACGWAGAIFEVTPSFGQEQ